jgi:DNA-binding LytR/AlgR family response regulator
MDTPLRTIIVENDHILLKRIRRIFEECGKVEIIGEFHTAKDFLIMFNKMKPDFIMIDIELPDEDGIEVAKKIREFDSHIPLIFLTGQIEYAAESFLIDATDYILKPFDSLRIYKSIQKVKRKLNVQPFPEPDKKYKVCQGKISIKGESGYLFLNISEIILIKKEGKRTVLNTLEGYKGGWMTYAYYTNESMKDLHEKLDQKVFMRTHNSFIVNLKWIHEVVRFTPEVYKIKFKNSKEYALLNRNKLNNLMECLRWIT